MLTNYIKFIFSKIISITISFIILLILLEIMLRILNPLLNFMENLFNRQSWVTSHSVWSHWHNPEFTTIFPSPDIKISKKDVVYHYDKNGFRISKEWKKTQEDEYNNFDESIFILGDSFTVGYYFEDTMANILEKKLNKKFDKKKWKVYNSGVASHSPLAYFLRYKTQISLMNPSLIVLNIDLTDVLDDARHLNSLAYDEQGVPSHIKQTKFRVIKDFLRKNFFFVRALYTLRAKLPSLVEQHGIYVSTFPIHHADSVDKKAKEDFDFMLYNITNIIKLAKLHDVEIILTTYPHLHQIIPHQDYGLLTRRMEYKIRELCLKTNIPFFSAYDGLKSEILKGNDIYLNNDMHFNPNGQKIWGYLFSDWLINEIKNKRVLKKIN
jgi:hypothetical protein